MSPTRAPSVFASAAASTKIFPIFSTFDSNFVAPVGFAPDVVVANAVPANAFLFSTTCDASCCAVAVDDSESLSAFTVAGRSESDTTSSTACGNFEYMFAGNSSEANICRCCAA